MTSHESDNCSEIDAREELEFIRRVMTDSRRVLHHNGSWQIVWGAISVIGIMAAYFNHWWRLGINNLLLWGIPVGCGWCWSIWYSMRERRKNRHATFAGRMLGEIWGACGLAFGITGFFGSTHISYMLIPAVFCLIMGIGAYLTARVANRRLLLVNALVWWAAATAMFLFPWTYNLLVMAGLTVILLLLPGLLCYFRSSRETRPS